MSFQAENPKEDAMDGTDTETLEESSEVSDIQNETINVAQFEQIIRERDEKIKSLEAKLSDFDRKFVEARAYVKKLETEVEQIRQRSERDMQKNIDKKVGEISSKLLPIVDSFELSLKAAAQNKSDFRSFLTGVKMILSQVEECLKGLGLERIPTVGQKFDPNIHEALMNRAVKTESEDGVVVDELKAGFRLNGQVVRPAQVAVGQFNE